MRLSFVAKLVIVDNSFFHPGGERRGPVFKAELATGSDRRFGSGGGFGLTASTEEDAVIEAVAAGATGYLQKLSGMDRLLSTLKLVAAGEMPVPADVVRRVFASIRRGARPEEEQDELTGREKEMLVSFCRGMSYNAIAEARGVKPVTIRNALYSIQSKLGLGTKQEIVVWAVRNGLLDD